MGLWGCNIYFNGFITDSEGDEIPISEAINHFFTSPFWTDLGASIMDTITYARSHGWEEVWKMVIELSDPHGEQNAFKVPTSFTLF
jgi:DnaJ family protein C protein 22